MDIVKTMVPYRLHQRIKERTSRISLGFDPSRFYFEPHWNEKERTRLNIPFAARVIITATRLIPQKRLENIIDLVDRLNDEGAEVHYIVVGFTDDSYGAEVKEYIAQKTHSDRFHCFPFLEHKRVNELYHAADLAWFPTTVISIFEALGSGLPCILPSRPAVNHILTEGQNGWYVHDDRPEQVFREALENLDQLKPRHILAQSNHHQFSWGSIAKKVLQASHAETEPTKQTINQS